MRKTPLSSFGLRFIASFICISVTLGLHNSVRAKDEVKLTFTRGTNMAVAASPDGETLVIDLQGTLWTLDIDGGKAKAITDPLADSRRPHWSPNGKQIVFESFKDGHWHIWMANRNGKKLKQLTFGKFDDREPRWHPDGTRIVFSSDRAGNFDLWEVKVFDRKLIRLTEDPANDYFPAWSPNGSELVFVSDRGKGTGLHQFNVEVKEAVSLGLFGEFAAPSWSKDGNDITYVQTINGRNELKRLYMSSGEVASLSGLAEDVFPFQATWLDERTYLYSADGQIRRRELEDTRLKVVKFRAEVELERPEYERKVYDFQSADQENVLGILGPALSPDGATIAFTALGDLWLWQRAGGTLQLTNDAFMDLDPVWSPDGTKLAFVSDRGGKMEIWIHKLDDGSFERAAELPAEANLPSWSPDGKQMAFHQSLGGNGLGPTIVSVLDLASGNVRAVHRPLWGPSRPSWSPDGRTLAVSAIAPASSRFRAGTSRILMISLSGQQERWVSIFPNDSLGQRGRNGPVWSPDGRMIAYQQAGVLWITDVNARGYPMGRARQLTDELAEQLSWSGDSRSLAYVSNDRLKRVDVESGRSVEIPLSLKWRRDVPRGRLVVHAGKLFDGESRRARSNVDIIIDDNVITDISRHKSWPDEQTVIDASAHTVIPGLFDRHVHQRASLGETLGRIWLAFGVTSVREPGADPYDALERKEAWASGRRIGPRQFFTGGQMDGTRTYFSFANAIVNDHQLEMELDRAEVLGYDLIKTYIRLPDHLQKRVVERAHEIGIPVSSHEIYPAVAFGTDAVEHLRGNSRRGFSPKQSDTGASYDDFVDLIAKSGMALTPTIVTRGFASLSSKDSRILLNRQYTTLYSQRVRAGTQAFIRATSGALVTGDDVLEAMQQTVKNIVEEGGRITAGTDSPILPYGLALLVELQLYVEAGLSPHEALMSATSWAADATGVGDHLGRIEAGKIADLVIVDGDPLRDISALYNVQGVVKNGRYYGIEELLTAPSPAEAEDDFVEE